MALARLFLLDAGWVVFLFFVTLLITRMDQAHERGRRPPEPCDPE